MNESIYQTLTPGETKTQKEILVTTKTIYDMIMPDLAQRKAALQSLIAKHSTLEFAAMVCGELSPMFYFMAQKSWEMLENPELLKEVEDVCNAANKLSPDLIKMFSWLMLLLQYRRQNDLYKEVHRLIARHLILTDRKKRKLRKRFLQLIDNPGVKFNALALVTDNLSPQTMGSVANSRDDLMVSEYGETMDTEHEWKAKGSQIENTLHEVGIPRLEWLGKSSKPTREQVKLYSKDIAELQEKRKQGNLSDEDSKKYNQLVRYVYKGRIRYDYPKTDNAGANLRSQKKNFCKGLIEKIGNPKFGSDFIQEGLPSTGRHCKWIVKGIANEWLGIGRDGKDLPPRVLNVDDMNRALGAVLSGERWTNLKEAHLRGLSSVGLTMVRALYETGRQSRQLSGYLPLNETYQKYEASCRCDWQARDLGGKTNLFEMLEKGARHFGFIE